VSYERALNVALACARKAGATLRAAFHENRDVDKEAEREIRETLRVEFPSWGYRGEETGAALPADGETNWWVVDPNDGTFAFLSGFRGAAVSIALLHDRVPVLGVVYAYAAPDDNGDLIYWAEGCGPLRRNGAPLAPRAWRDLQSGDVALISQHADLSPAANAKAVAPARYLPTTSIAYRLALAAAGEGVAGVSLNSPCSWDYAAGHALLRAVDGDLVNEDGRSVTYSADAHSHTRFCFGGGPGIARTLARAPWGEVLYRAATAPAAPWDTCLPLKRATISDAGVLSRAQGCWLGQLSGDALGSLVEFRSAEEIQREHPGRVRRLEDGGTWHTIAGQPTDDSELALMLARSILRHGGYSSGTAATAYGWWMRSHPFDVGNTTQQALGEIGEDLSERDAEAAATSAASRHSQANGSLMRISPLGIWGWRKSPDVLAEAARRDSRLTHPNPVCQDACAVFVIAIARAIESGDDATAVYRYALDWARKSAHPDIVEILELAAREIPANFSHHQGWVRIALQNAFYRLLHATSLEEGVVDTVMCGGDTDTNAAIAGALLGAVHGRDEVPAQWRTAVLTCRPLPGTWRPRPKALWPVDALVLAERLLAISS